MLRLLLNTTTNFLIWAEMKRVQYIHWKYLMFQTHNPMHEQKKLLEKLLKDNANTAFGKEHRFATIKDYKEYQDLIRPQEYEDLRPYIEEQERTGKPQLTKEKPILYERTSGTTNKPKLLPVLESSIRRFKDTQKVFTYAQYRLMPQMFSGKILAIVGPAVEGRTKKGTSFGSMSGLAYEELPAFVKEKYVVPSWVFSIEDYDLKYKVIAACALRHQIITAMGSANPSTFLKLISVVRENHTLLINLVRSGDFTQLEGLSEKHCTLIKKSYTTSPERANELESIFGNNDTVTYADLWPKLKSVATWKGGSCSVLIPHLKSLIPMGAVIMEIGYFASEFRGSLTIDPIRGVSIPTFHENFFEFVEKTDWENKRQNFLTLDCLEQGKEYYIFATTQNGLYRYNINDIIKVTDFFNKTPVIEFVQKGRGVTNLTGEKLYESQLLYAMEQLRAEYNVDIKFFLALGDKKTLQYTLYVEHAPLKKPDVSQVVDEYLRKINIEYKSKRESGRLKPLDVIFLKPNAEDEYKKFNIEKGQRENQFKVVRLQYSDDATFDFRQYAY